MSRWVSFIVLLGVLAVIAAFFIRVMAEFLVPLFVALLLVVIFRPLHLRILAQMPNRPAVAAFLTTCLVSLSVFVPILVMVVMAAAEGRELIKRFDQAVLQHRLSDFRVAVGLDIPHADRFAEVETALAKLRESLAESDTGGVVGRIRQWNDESYIRFAEEIQQIEAKSRLLGDFNRLAWPPESQAPLPSDQYAPLDNDPEVDSLAAEPNGTDGLEQDSAAPAIADESFLGLRFSIFGRESTDLIPAADRIPGSTPLEQQWFNYVYQLRETLLRVQAEQSKPDQERDNSFETKLQSSVAICQSNFREFQVRLLGGPLMAWLKETFNPQDDEIDQYSLAFLDFAKRNFVSWGSVVTVYLGRLLFGATIIVVALYFFLLDGPRMVQAIMNISPLDNRHEAELMLQFDRTSRAVVVATLAAAIAQGLLAGLGFYLVGVQSVFLLTMLTMLLAMIPFLGAASVWFPVVVYVAFFESRPLAATVLFLYSALIVSTIDNIIKPYILHGQSNLHPLLALLSVIGGVTALGPIGILLGPMLVVFLQTLLKILKDELLSLEQQRLQDRSEPSQVTPAVRERASAEATSLAVPPPTP